MSTLDFFAGRQAANLANRRTENDANLAVAEWQDYARRLELRLKQAELDFAKAETGRIGFAHLFRVIAEELRRANPAHRLLDRDIQLNILGEKSAQKALEMGYEYNFKRDIFIKK